jgi:hypothetical protein
MIIEVNSQSIIKHKKMDKNLSIAKYYIRILYWEGTPINTC